MNSLPPLSVPRRLIYKRKASAGGSGEGEGEGEEVESVNQTDQEKSVIKGTDSLMEVGW